MMADHTWLRGPTWFGMRTATGGWPFVLLGASVVAGPTPTMHFVFAGLFGITWALTVVGVPGTTTLAGNLTLTNSFLGGCTLTWPARVIMEQEMSFDNMKNTVDELDVPSNTVLRWEYFYTRLPWPMGETCAGGSIIWTDSPRPRPIYKRNSLTVPRYSPQAWRFVCP